MLLIYVADICSLRADVERLAFSVIWVYMPPQFCHLELLFSFSFVAIFFYTLKRFIELNLVYFSYVCFSLMTTGVRDPSRLSSRQHFNNKLFPCTKFKFVSGEWTILAFD